MPISDDAPRLLRSEATATPAAPAVSAPGRANGRPPTMTVFVVSSFDPARHLHVSEGFEVLTGHPGSDLLEDAGVLMRMVHPEDVPVAVTWTRQFWAGVPGHGEFRIVRRDGGIRWVRVASTVLPGPGGDGLQMLTALDDVTERVAAVDSARRAEASARAAHDAKSSLISRMSHELRTPLNAVIGFGQLLERRLTDPDDQSSVQFILSSGRSLLAMIDQVVEVSRIGAGAVSLTIEPIDAASLVDEVVTTVLPAADRAGVAVAVTGGPSGMRLLADRRRLVQVLRDLLISVIGANAAGRRIHVSWSATGGASVTIRQESPGEPLDVRPLLLRAPDQGGGTGPAAGAAVGLSTALVELMGGSVSIEPAAGTGTSLTVRLPGAPGRPTAAWSAEAAPVALPKGTSPATLLYIEDSRPDVRVVASLLGLRPGWQLAHAGSGRAGLEIAREQRPDVVLLDLHLPDCFGLSVLETLKADPLTADIPVVILSADTRQTQVDRLLLAGADQYLTKPLNVREVLLLLDGISADQLTRMVDA